MSALPCVSLSMLNHQANARFIPSGVAHSASWVTSKVHNVFLNHLFIAYFRTPLNCRFGKAVASESCMKEYASPKSFDMSLGNETICAGQGEQDEDEEDEDGGSVRAFAQRDRQSVAWSRGTRDEVEFMLRSLPNGEPLSVRIQATFNSIIANSIMEKNVF